MPPPTENVFLLVFPTVFLGCYGFYYIVAALMLDYVVNLGRASYEIKPLDTRKRRVTTFITGVVFVVVSILLGELSTAGHLLKALLSFVR